MQYVSYLRIAAVLTVAASQFVGAADGVWTNLIDGGLWSAGGNWQDEVVASGAGATASFNELDITADTTVRLDAPTTIGNLTFGDTDTASAADWVLDNNDDVDNQLTLDGVAPTITVNALGNDSKVEIRTGINGVNGLIKAGVGTLALAQTNFYSGATALTGGALRLKRPSDLSGLSEPVQNGLALWLDATHGVTTNAAGNVTEWADRSGNNHDAYNNAATGPTVTADINGLPTLRFTSLNSQFLECGGLGGLNDLTVFFVFKLASTTNSLTSLMSTDGRSTPEGRAIHYLIRDTQKLSFYVNGPGHFENNTPVSAGSVQVKGNIEQGLNARHYFNGAFDGFITRSYGTTKSLELFRIGAWMPYDDNLTFRRFLNGSIGEILIYNRALNEIERNAVGLYLAQKWGVTENSYNQGVDVLPSPSAVVLDADTTLVLDGVNQKVASINTATDSALELGGTLTIAGTQPSVIAGDVGGYGGLILEPGGTLELAGDCSYRSSTQIGAGSTLKLSGCLYSAGADEIAKIIVEDNATLELSQWGDTVCDSLGAISSDASNLLFDNSSLRVTGTTFGGRGAIFSGDLTLEAADGANWHIVGAEDNWLFDSGAALLLTGAGNGYFSKRFNASGGITKTGSGRWTLGGTNSFSGPLTVAAGTLQLVHGNVSALPVAGAALWLDAMRGVETSTGGNVTRWRDLSGYARDVTSANGPTVTADINGLPTLRFTRESAQYLEGGGLRNMDEVTIFMVHKVATLTPSDWYALLATDTTSSTSYGSGVHYNIEKSLKINFYLGGSDPSRCDSDSVAVAEVPVIYEALHYTNACYHYKNGVYDGGVTRTVKQKRLDDYRIGAWNNSRYYDGSMGEIIIYNRALTTAEREQVYAYLNAKWMNPSGIDTPQPGDSSIMAVDAQVTVDADAVLSLSGQNHTLGTLQGGGVVSNGMVTAVIQPGGAGVIGSLQLMQATLAGTLVVDVNGSECDALHVNGDLDLSGLSLCFSDAEYPRASKAYVLATYTGALTAPFGEVDLPGSWTVSYATAQTVKLICNSGTTFLVR